MSDVPVFTIVRTFDADRETVFDAWADPDKMEQWSGPPGAKLTRLSGDIVEGSLMHTRSDHPDMGTTYTLAKWTRIDRPGHIAWEQSFADAEGRKVTPHFFPAWPLTLLTEVDFRDTDGGTEITLKWTPIEASAEAIAVFVEAMGSMEQGWGGSFDKLAEFLANA
ncbi:SRPBCC family protein [Sphingomicrobium sediminis]|uniref:SRPBCC domain-containing protein n=1 Tax=Sphingomicrobium sediminis TaxID=2950949 RepID=A0A9X2J335_9SPHN|nr:SRPBCC domain-containing protein [Sphingomicrobium sediminis]MCM8556901.1 SRPBCC domain-containing protein [Sphingomicrobium sediminis]